MAPDMKPKKNDLPSTKSQQESLCDETSKTAQAKSMKREEDPLMTPGTGVTVRMSDLDAIRTGGVDIAENVIDGYFALRLKQLDYSNVKYLPVTFMVPSLIQDHPAINEVDESGAVVYQINQQMMNIAISPDLEFLLLTVCRGMHYFLVKLNVRTDEIQVFDSIPISQERLPSVENAIREILSSVELELGRREWKICVIQNTPIQEDSHNCGLYVLYNFEAVLCRTVEFTPTLTLDVIRLFRATVLNHFENYRNDQLLAKNIEDPGNLQAIDQPPQVLPVWRTVDRREYTMKIKVTTKFVNITVNAAEIAPGFDSPSTTSDTSTESEEILKSSQVYENSSSSPFVDSGETEVESPGPRSFIDTNLSKLAQLNPISEPSGKFFTSTYPLLFTADHLRCLDYSDPLYPNVVEAYLYLILDEAKAWQIYTLLTSQFVQTNYAMHNGRYVTDSEGNRCQRISINNSETANVTSRYFVSPFVSDGEYSLIYGDMQKQVFYIFNPHFITPTRSSLLWNVGKELASYLENKGTTLTYKISSCLNVCDVADSGILILQQFERL
ncbi:Ubiquitin-like-specific protease 1A [Folsomia candida]|uniref:Ubiquitin-like-specific protease 1A n=1 Tax=Folsomia candida TaxID=158441 RepID=A0A226D5D5_FOLCA|nr:Ubiquitin-like-specific protease 1A [Folsomia candida]